MLMRPLNRKKSRNSWPVIDRVCLKRQAVELIITDQSWKQSSFGIFWRTLKDSRFCFKSFWNFFKLKFFTKQLKFLSRTWKISFGLVDGSLRFRFIATTWIWLAKNVIVWLLIVLKNTSSESTRLSTPFMEQRCFGKRTRKRKRTQSEFVPPVSQSDSVDLRCLC